MANIITNLKPRSTVNYILGIGILLLCIIRTATGEISIITAIFCIIPIILFTQKVGYQVNIDNKTYRKMWSMVGIRYGKWKPCPNFEYISVFRTNEYSTSYSEYGTDTTTSETVILVNLFYGKRHITFYKSIYKEDAFKVAKQFKVAFNIDILDATGAEKV